MRDYMIRLLYEFYSYPNSYFITLTFNDDALEWYKTDLNKAVREFLDRFRKVVNDNKQIRHWFVCEFGTLHGRPHYHGILFNLPLEKFCKDSEELKEILESNWYHTLNDAYFIGDRTKVPNGFVDISRVRGEGAPRYISKYVTKSCSDYKKTPRIITSAGIGKGYLNPENLNFHKDKSGALRPYILKNGYKIPLPRYYADKIFTAKDKISMLLDRTCTAENGDMQYIWQGTEYPTEYEFKKARLQTYKDNVRIGLSQKPKQKEKDLINNSNLQNYESNAFTCGL